jgi:hypothetical protein
VVGGRGSELVSRRSADGGWRRRRAILRLGNVIKPLHLEGRRWQSGQRVANREGATRRSENNFPRSSGSGGSRNRGVQVHGHWVVNLKIEIRQQTAYARISEERT